MTQQYKAELFNQLHRKGKMLILPEMGYSNSNTELQENIKLLIN